ncbi:MAG: hypothetical protein RR672_05345, partial [Raoultibacter sp.]
CGLLGYLALGHSWNVAASNIDDATGRMDGYTAIVFEGTVDPTLVKEDTDSAANKKTPGTSASQNEAATNGSLSGAETGTESGAGTGLGASNSTNSESSESTKTPTSPNEIEDADKQGVTNEGESSGAASGGSSGTTSGSGISGGSDSTDEVSTSSGSSASTKKKIPVDLADVEESYLEKNATVFTLDTLKLGQYSEGTILRKGDHRFGVFSVDPKTTTRSIARMVEYFKEHEVDFIVALTPDKELVESAEGIDIVISTQDEGLFVMGETINGTFYVNAPSIGSAGVILISPSSVVSAKVIQPE